MTALVPEAALPFTREEYAARLAKTRAAMDAAGIELLVATDPSNMAWLTGYDGWSFYVHQCVLVPPVRGADLVRPRPGRERRASHRVSSSRDNVVAYPDHYVQSTERHPDGAPRLPHRGARVRRDADRRRDGQLLLLGRRPRDARALPAGRRILVDATGLVNWERAVKSERELDYMRTAGRIVTLMHERIAEIAEPGRRKNDVAAEILRRDSRDCRMRAATIRPSFPLLPSGAGRVGRPPHVERCTAARGRGHLLRGRGLLPPLSLSLVPDGLPRGAAAPGVAGGSGPPRSDGRGSREGAFRLHLRRRGDRLLRHPREARHPQGQSRPAIRSGSPILRTGASAR